MENDKITIYNSGDIIMAYYGDMDNKEKLGIFCVLYDEFIDKESNCNLNLTALKITTKSHEDYNYYVEIEQGNGGLASDSRVCCSKTHTLHKKKVRVKIGSIHGELLKKVLLCYNKYNSEITRQVVSRI